MMDQISKMQIVKWYFNRHGIENDPFMAMAISTTADIIYDFMRMRIPPFPEVIRTLLQEIYGWNCEDIDIHEIIQMVKEVLV